MTKLSDYCCIAVGMFMLTAVPLCGFTQNERSRVGLDNLEAFSSPSGNWMIASDPHADFSRPFNLAFNKGQGVLVYNNADGDHQGISTKEEFSDIELHLDFMLSRNAAAAVYLGGRYPVLLNDAWASQEKNITPAGTLITGTNPQRGIPVFLPAYMNTGKAPGLWQHLDVIFHAPTFDRNGAKTHDARFEEVRLNGVAVQQEVTAWNSSSASLSTEKNAGPVVFTVAQGPVAFRNISISKLNINDTAAARTNQQDQQGTENPVLINAVSRPYLLRGFVHYGDKKLTHVISLGDPGGINFAYDIKQGALFEIWRGRFMNVTGMWVERGEEQLAVPMGSVATLSDAPVVAALNNESAAWPDSVAFDDLTGHGYTVNAKRYPTFTYNIQGQEVKDSFDIPANGLGIDRTVTLANAAPNMYIRIATAGAIENMNGNDLYAVDDKTYYIRLDKGMKPLLRNAGGKQELLVKYQQKPVTYSIIW